MTGRRLRHRETAKTMHEAQIVLGRLLAQADAGRRPESRVLVRDRVKYAIFSRDRRAQLLIDDSTGFRAVLVPATVEIRADLEAELPRFRAIREKHAMAVPNDEEHLQALAKDAGVLLAITPDGPPSSWTSWGLD
jgi:hypothetical protein